MISAAKIRFFLDMARKNHNILRFEYKQSSRMRVNSQAPFCRPFATPQPPRCRLAAGVSLCFRLKPVCSSIVLRLYSVLKTKNNRRRNEEQSKKKRARGERGTKKSRGQGEVSPAQASVDLLFFLTILQNPSPAYLFGPYSQAQFIIMRFSSCYMENVSYFCSWIIPPIRVVIVFIIN